MYTYQPDGPPTYYGYQNPDGHDEDHFAVWLLPHRDLVPDCYYCGRQGTHYTRRLLLVGRPGPVQLPHPRPDPSESTYCTRCWTPVRDELVLYRAAAR